MCRRAERVVRTLEMVVVRQSVGLRWDTPIRSRTLVRLAVPIKNTHPVDGFVARVSGGAPVGRSGMRAACSEPCGP